MNRVLLLAVVFLFALPGPIPAAIVYSGSQNVTLRLDPQSVPPMTMASMTIHIAGQTGESDKWDDFAVNLSFDSTMAMSHLAISAPMGVQGVGMGGIMGMGSFASKLMFGDMIPGPDSSFLSSAILYNAGGGQFDVYGGYIGLMMDIPGGSPHYGWLHMSGMSDIGLSTQSGTFDGWAYEDVPGRAIGAGAIPAPAALVLGGLGIGLVTWLRRRRVV